MGAPTAAPDHFLEGVALLPNTVLFPLLRSLQLTRSELSEAVSKLERGQAARGAQPGEKNLWLAGFLVRLNMSQAPGETTCAPTTAPPSNAPNTAPRNRRVPTTACTC